MIIRYNHTQKNGDYTDRKNLQILDADQESLDKVLKYFAMENEGSQAHEVSASNIFIDSDKVGTKRTGEAVMEAFSALGGVLKSKQINKEAVTEHVAKEVSRPRSTPLMRNSLQHETVPYKNTETMTSDDMRYEVEVDCPSCFSTHNVWSKPYHKFINCKECFVKLRKEGSLPNSLEADKNGIYFKANKLFNGEV